MRRRVRVRGKVRVRGRVRVRRKVRVRGFDGTMDPRIFKNCKTHNDFFSVMIVLL